MNGIICAGHNSYLICPRLSLKGTRKHYMTGYCRICSGHNSYSIGLRFSITWTGNHYMTGYCIICSGDNSHSICPKLKYNMDREALYERLWHNLRLS